METEIREIQVEKTPSLTEVTLSPIVTVTISLQSIPRIESNIGPIPSMVNVPWSSNVQVRLSPQVPDAVTSPSTDEPSDIISGTANIITNNPTYTIHFLIIRTCPSHEFKLSNPGHIGRVRMISDLHKRPLHAGERASCKIVRSDLQQRLAVIELQSIECVRSDEFHRRGNIHVLQ